MSSGAAFTSERELVELVAARDLGAVAEVYDRHAPMVREYCAELCPPEVVPEATLAAFVDFLARAQNGHAEQGADQLLQRAARTSVAARLRAADGQSPACRAVPELLAARANDELARDDEALQAHLEGCSACRRVADSLTSAEDAFQRAPRDDPPARLREDWIAVASAGSPPKPPVALAGSPPKPDNSSAPEPKPVEEREIPSSEAYTPDATGPELPARVRARRGGLLGAARRVVASRRR